MSDEVVVKKKRVQVLTPEQKLAKKVSSALKYASLSASQKADLALRAAIRRASLPPSERLIAKAAFAARYSGRSAEKVATDLAKRRLRQATRTPERVSADLEKARLLWANRPLQQVIKKRETSALWRSKNPEASFVSASNRRARLRSVVGTFTTSDIKSLFKAQRGVCPNCQTPLIPRGPGRYHVDHVIPIALGGSNWPDNLQLLCPPCNLSKSDKHPDVWMADNPRKRDVGFIPF